MVEENILKEHDSLNLRQIESIKNFNQHIKNTFNKKIDLLKRELIELRKLLDGSVN